MTAKQYLNQVRMLDTTINAKEEEIYQLKQSACYVQSVVISERVQSSKDNKSNSVIDRIVDLENEIVAEIERLVNLKIEVREKINNVYNNKFIALLTYKYIDGFTFEEIAERMNVSPSTISIWHGQALQIFRKENNMK